MQDHKARKEVTEFQTSTLLHPLAEVQTDASQYLCTKKLPGHLSIHAMHQRKDIFGEDGEEFCPGRWERSQYSWLSQVAYVCMHFSKNTNEFPSKASPQPISIL